MASTPPAPHGRPTAVLVSAQPEARRLLAHSCFRRRATAGFSGIAERFLPIDLNPGVADGIQRVLVRFESSPSHRCGFPARRDALAIRYAGWRRSFHRYGAQPGFLSRRRTL